MEIKLLFRHTPVRWENGIVGIGGWAIRKLSKIPYDHVEIFIDDCCYGATFNGIRRMHIDDWNLLYKDQSSEIRYIKSKYSEANIIHLFEIIKGTPYDYAALIHHFIYIKTGKWLGKKKKGALNKLYCSEFVAHACGVKNSWKMGMKEIHELSFEI